MYLTFDQMSSGFHHNFCPEGPTNFHQLQNFWMPGPAVRSVATSRWSVPRPAGISYPEMPWKNLQSWHNRNRLHLHLWVSFSKLSILLLHLLRSQGDETVKGSMGGSKVSDAQNHLPRSKMLRSNNWNDLQFTGLLHSRQGIQVTCWTQWRWWWRHALKSLTDDQLLTPNRFLRSSHLWWVKVSMLRVKHWDKKTVDLTKITSETKKIHQPFTKTKKKLPRFHIPKNSGSPPLPEMADWRCACQWLPAPWPKTKSNQDRQKSFLRLATM